MQGLKLPAKYVNEVGARHRRGETYEQIVDGMKEHYPWCSNGSVHRALTNWRKKNRVDSPLTVAKRLSVKIIEHYESTNCTMRVGDLVDWSNANCPRPDRPWDRRLISGMLRNWKMRTGENELRDRTLSTWEAVHQLFMTGYSMEQAAAELNSKGVLNYQDQWTASTVAHFHARHAKKFNVDLESLAMRTENEILTIGYLVSMLRVDGYSFNECTDYLTENELYFFRGRSWSTSGLKAVYQRAREILNEIEGYIEMSAAIELRDARTITSAAMSSLTIDDDDSYVALRIHSVEVEPDEPEEVHGSKVRARKVDELNRVAFRIAELRRGGMLVHAIVDALDSESPRPGGWSKDHVSAVERYGESQLGIAKAIAKRHYGRDHSAVVPIISELVINKSHDTVASELNERGIQNSISPGCEWNAVAVGRVIGWQRKQAERANKAEVERQAAERKKLLGSKRPMRSSDIAIREHARSLLAKKQEAFDRATQIHAQIEALQAELARANNEVAQAMDAEELLIETGPKPLVAELVELRQSKPFQKLTRSDIDRSETTTKANEQIERIKEVTARIVAEDWR